MANLGGLFDTVGVLKRNPNIFKTPAIINAARRGIYQYRKLPESKYCHFCGRSGDISIHHIFPVAIFPEYAEDIDEMIALCNKRGCHRLLGHHGDYSRGFCPNIKDWRTEPLVYIKVEL